MLTWAIAYTVKYVNMKTDYPGVVFAMMFSMILDTVIIIGALSILTN